MPRPRQTITGRPVVITGAASGIGRSLAQRLSRAGSAVAIADPEGRGRGHDQMAAEFEAITMTSPEKAAEIICRGVERGKARILVGPDAYAFDALARLAPVHYFDIIARAEKRLRSRPAGPQQRAPQAETQEPAVRR